MPLVIDSAPNLTCPLPALRKILKNWEQCIWTLIVVLPQESIHGLEPSSLCRTHHGNRRPQFRGEFENVERPTSLGKNIRHIQEHECRQA